MIRDTQGQDIQLAATKSYRKYWFGAASVALVTALAAYSLSASNGDTQLSLSRDAVKTAAVVRGDLVRDLATTLAYQGNNELGDLCTLYNETAQKLHQERQWIYQRELMFDKVLHNSPQALLLMNSKWQIVYTNHSVRGLLFAGIKVEGETLSNLFSGMPKATDEALQRGGEGLFSVEQEQQQRLNWHLATCEFLLNNHPHNFFILKPMTREISRQEVQVWKKVVRIISHELNNSLVPISSMLHSGRLIAQRSDDERLERVFNTIDERIACLSEFVQGYGKFAKLPQPQLSKFRWAELIQGLSQQLHLLASGASGKLRS
ncbi:hypothetical protein WCN91_11500 [Pseudoalteromonas sp. YIC-827]|uniref:Signal transduction histidine kinase dimerisation/phosphoacceptor domain-containing protein n=1 Tax=Pseudoalteromonas qingdaonensis TaxID=3131913 RepID=A0ABU9MXN0_9GAMM